MSAVAVAPLSSAFPAGPLAYGAPASVPSPLGGPFGRALRFAGADAGLANTDALAMPASGDVAFAGGAGSIEFAVARTSGSTTQKVMGQWSADAGNWLVYFGADDKLNFGWYGTDNVFRNLTSSAAIGDAAAHRVEASWDGATYRLFVDGALVASVASTVGVRSNPVPLTVGRGETTDDALKATLDQVRFSRVARHTAAHVVATLPLPDDADTTLLLTLDGPYGVSAARFTPSFAAPVLAKGGSYGGWAADALAAPAACYDGTRWVMAVSLWSVAAAKWATAFFVSANLSAWAYVAGSLRAPTGSDYILGNGGVAWWQGKLWHAYNHYPSAASTPGGVTVQWSADLAAWTTTVTHGLDGYGADPSLCVNPQTGRLECWYLDAARRACMSDTADGTTWVARGVQYVAAFNVVDAGEPEVCYVDGWQYLVCDGATAAGNRSIQMLRRPIGARAWQVVGEALTRSADAWSGVQVFDGCLLGRVDTGDGRGRALRLLYAGGNVVSSTDDTSSSIGLAYLPLSAGAAAKVLVLRSA